MEPDLIYVIGDSHTRTFAFNKLYVPIFVSSGKNMLVDNKENLEKTLNYLYHTLRLIPDNSTVYLLIGEPTIRAYLSAEKQIVSQFVENYISNMNRLCDSLSMEFPNKNLNLLPPVPRRNDKYAELWLHVREAIQQEGWSCFDCFDFSVDARGVLNKQLVGDFIHANECLADGFAKYLGYQYEESSDRYKWSSMYYLPNNSRIWGGTNISFLRYEGDEPRDWRNISEPSLAKYKAVKIIDYVLSRMYKKKFIVHVHTDDEGLFSIESTHNTRFFASDSFKDQRFDVLRFITSTKNLDSQANEQFRVMLLDQAKLERKYDHEDGFDLIVRYYENPAIVEVDLPSVRVGSARISFEFLRKSMLAKFKLAALVFLCQVRILIRGY